MADSVVRIRIDADAAGVKRATDEARAAHAKYVADLQRKLGDIAAFKAAEAGSRQSGAALDEARKKLEFFKRSAEIGGAEGARQFAADIRRASAEVERAAASARTQQAAVAALSRTLAAAGIDSGRLAAEQARLKIEVAAAGVALNTRLASLRESAAASSVAASADARLGEQVRATGHHMARMAAEVFAVTRAVQGFNAVVAAGAGAERLGNVFAFAAGSMEKGRAELAFVRAEAERLGLPLIESADAFAKLEAAARGTTLEGQQARDIFTAVASAGRVMGLSAGEMEGALLAVQQMISKGTVSAEELRGQLGERLPGAFGIAARSMGVTEREFNKLLETGQVLSADFLPKFAAELQKTVGGALPDAANSFAAQAERLKNTWNEFLITLAQAGVLETVGNEIRLVTERLRQMAETGELQSMIDKLASAMSQLARTLGTVAGFTAENANAIVLLAQAYAGFRIASLVTGLLGLGNALNAVRGAADLATGQASKQAAAFIRLGEAAAFVVRNLGRFTLYGALIGVIAKTVSAAGEYNDALRETLHREAERERALRRLKDAALEAGDAQIGKADEVAAASDRQLAKDLAALKARRELALAQATEEDRKAAPDATRVQALIQQAVEAKRLVDAIEREQARRVRNEDIHKQVLKVSLEGQTREVETALAAQRDVYRSAVADLEKFKQQQAATLAETQAFRGRLEAALAGGGKAEPTFGSITEEIVNIRQALASGDLDKALAMAKAARENIVKLAESGKESSTFVRGLADQVDALVAKGAEAQVKRQEAVVETARAGIEELQKKAAELKSITITPTVDAVRALAEVDAMRASLQNYLSANPLVQRVVIQQQADAALGLKAAPGKATGGAIFGPGTGTSDSILAWLSNNEHVLTAAEVQAAGGHDNIYRLRAMIRSGGLRGKLPGFASGGAVRRLTLPAFATGGEVDKPGISLQLLTTDGAGKVAEGLKEANKQIDMGIQGADKMTESTKELNAALAKAASMASGYGSAAVGANNAAEEAARKAKEEADRAAEANQRMAAEAKSMVAGLQDELDAQDKNYEAIERRRAAARRAALQAKLDEANASGNGEAAADIQKAIRLDAQVSSRRIAEARSRTQAEDAAARDEKAKTQPVKTVKVELKTPKGTETVETVAGGETALLSMLAAASRRSAR